MSDQSIFPDNPFDELASAISFDGIGSSILNALPGGLALNFLKQSGAGEKIGDALTSDPAKDIARVALEGLTKGLPITIPSVMALESLTNAGTVDDGAVAQGPRGDILGDLLSALNDEEVANLVAADLERYNREIASSGAGLSDSYIQGELGRLQEERDVRSNLAALNALLGSSSDATAANVRGLIDPNAEADALAALSAAYGDELGTGDLLANLANVISVGEQGVGTGPVSGDAASVAQQLAQLEQIAKREASDKQAFSDQGLEDLARIAKTGTDARAREAELDVMRRLAEIEDQRVASKMAEDMRRRRAAASAQVEAPKTEAEIREEIAEGERITEVEATKNLVAEANKIKSNIASGSASEDDLATFFTNNPSFASMLINEGVQIPEAVISGGPAAVTMYLMELAGFPGYTFPEPQ